MGYISLQIRSLCIPRNSHITIPFLLVQIYGHHDYNHLRHHGLYNDSSHSTSARHHLPSCIILASWLFYDHVITILTILTTHIFSYLSPTLPGLSLDLHSFDYSFLSCLCPFLLSLPHFPRNHSIFTYDVFTFGVTLCHGHSSIYSVVAVQCSSLALIS